MSDLSFIKANLYNALYLFPYEFVPQNANIILYGAGAVGKSYYLQLKKNHYCNVLKIVDMNYMNLSEDNYCVDAPNILSTQSFDYVVIAVLSYGMAQNIAREIGKEYNIPLSKIIVKEAISSVNLLEI